MYPFIPFQVSHLIQNNQKFSNLLHQIFSFFINLFDGARDDALLVDIAFVAALHGEGLSTAGLPVSKDAHVVAVDGALRKANDFI